MNIPLENFFHRQSTVNKYDMGHVLVIGGDHGTVGAARMAGEAALCVGAGLVTIAAPRDVAEKLEGSTEAIMTLALPESPKESIALLKTYIAERSVTVIVFGSGLHPENALHFFPLLLQVSLPVIIDAGGLTALHGELPFLRQISKRMAIILTPHTGEYQKITGSPLPSHTAGIQTMAQKFAKQEGVILVLKQHRTIVASPSDGVYNNTTGNPGLATAGTGDILAGCIAGIVAQKIPPFEAAAFGTYLHGLAGDKAAAINTEPGVTATDVIACIPAALHDVAEHGITKLD